MIPLLLIVGAIGFWAWKSGKLPAIGGGDVAATVAAVAGLRLLSTGKLLPAAIVLGGALYWFYTRRNGRVAAPAPAMDVDEARRLFSLPGGADRDAILAAHRRLIARVHPDAGGSAELSARVNAARDVLLAELRSRR